MKKTDLDLKRLKILRNVKTNIIINGWNDNIFSIITKRNKYKEEEVRALFSKGYKSLLELYLFSADQEMIKACNKIEHSIYECPMIHYSRSKPYFIHKNNR